MRNTTKHRKRRNRQLVSKMAIVARRYEETRQAIPPDRLESMLSGLDDGWEPIRQAIIRLAGERGEWAGYPLPVDDAELVIEPRHPLYATLNGARLDRDPKQTESAECEGAWEQPAIRVVNHWRDRRGWHVFITQDRQGRGTSHVVPKNAEVSRFDLLMNTIGASRAWSVSAEFTAMERLKTLITPQAMRYYVLVGFFIERSPRSGVTYIFRKGRPTVALSAGQGDALKILATLCLHPIGYYRETFAGSMVPTDDVIAHLLMMRGDERLFWAKCNQHDPSEPESGI